MKLGVVLRVYCGKMPIENGEKVIADLIARLKKDDPSLTGQKWLIPLGDDGVAFGMFLAFNRSVFVSEILKQEFPQINPYYMQLIKQADERAVFDRCKDKAKPATTGFGSATL